MARGSGGEPVRHGGGQVVGLKVGLEGSEGVEMRRGLHRPGASERAATWTGRLNRGHSRWPEDRRSQIGRLSSLPAS